MEPTDTDDVRRTHLKNVCDEFFLHTMQLHEKEVVDFVYTPELLAFIEIYRRYEMFCECLEFWDFDEYTDLIWENTNFSIKVSSLFKDIYAVIKRKQKQTTE